MNRFKLLPIIIAFIVLMSGCGAQSAATSTEPLPSDDGATEITIEVFDVGNFYANAALKFETLTGVKVNVINHYSPTTAIDDQDYAYIDRIPGELMAGKGADIYADINIDFTAIGKQGYLCNLADWVAADPDLSNEAYYKNIWQAEFDEGNVYSFPMFMICMSFGSDVEIPELEGKNLTWEEFIDVAKDINRNGVLLSLSDYQIFMQRFEESFSSFIDEKNGTQHLDSPEMIKLLKQCKEWSDQGLCIPRNAANYTDIFDNAFIKDYGCDINALTGVRPMDNTFGGNPYWYDKPSDSETADKANELLTTDYICINAASKYKGTAWKFVKYLLTKDIQATAYRAPVNREAAADYIKSMLTNCVGYSKDNSEAEQAIEETQKILDGIRELPNSPNRKAIVKDVIAQEAKRFFNNETSAEETAKNMAEAAKLYMKEQ